MDERAVGRGAVAVRHGLVLPPLVLQHVRAVRLSRGPLPPPRLRRGQDARGRVRGLPLPADKPASTSIVRKVNEITFTL